MTRAPRTLLLSAAVLAIAACADSATKVTSPVDLTPSFDRSPELNDGHGHIMKIKAEGKKDADQAQQDAKDAAKINSRTNGTGIYFHGGPVLQPATNVAAIYWASSIIYNGGPTLGSNGAGSGDNSLVGFFLSHLTNSSYFNINSTYTDGSGKHIANIVNYTQYWANNSYNVPSGSTSVSDAQMVAMLQYGFDHSLLTYDAGTLYAIFTPGTVNLGGGFGTQYCAYHYHGTVTVGTVSRTVLYAAMPYDQAYPGVCTEGTASPNKDPGADSEINTLAHETEETTTDMMGTAWYDQRGYENADKCAWTWGSTYTSNGGVANINVGGKDFLVQQNWVNSGSGGCKKSWP
jgi:hypothetical protein